jgi:leucyl aminopeptidase
MTIEMNATSSKLTWALSKLEEERANLVLVLFSGESLKDHALAADQATNGLVSRRIKIDEFDPKSKEAHVIDSDLSVPGLDKIILVGMGARSKLTLAGLRKTLAEAFTHARDVASSSHLVFPLIDVDLRGFTVEQYAEVVAEYAVLADYEQNHQKTRPWLDEAPRTHFKSLTLLCSKSTLSAAKRGIKMGRLLGEATNRARDIVNEPSKTMTPQKLAQIALQLQAESGGQLVTKILRKKEISDLRMGGVLAVNSGSPDPAVLIDIRWDPPCGVTEPTLGLVGKGITFDSGGYGIKDDKSMRNMKFDMAGAAAVLYAMSLLPIIKPRISVRAVIAATDNMIDAKAMRPDDIIKMMNGTTVEVGHTDCEGRLTLADALHYVQTKSEANIVIDLATLTGAVEEALGSHVTGIFGNDERFTREFLRSAERAGEAMHELPLDEVYRDGNKSTMADLTNDGAGPGAIIAAWFLREFVQEGVKWVHADIAGTAFRTEEHGVDPEGATGVGVRTLGHLLRQYA